MKLSVSAKYKSIIVFLLAMVATFLPLLIIELRVLQYTSGYFIYPLDDTFIHMQLGKNLAMQHSWGINPGQFASASSSLFYTILLGFCFTFFGVHSIIPFLINCLAGILILLVIQKWLIRQRINTKGQLFIIGLVIFLTPLATLIMSGMEHTLQCLFSLLFVIHFSDWLNRNVPESKKLVIPWKVFLYGMLTVAIRYEGMFIIATALLILLFRRNLQQAMLLGTVSLLPVVIFGFYSVIHGGFALPNSVLVKSDNIQFSIRGLIKFGTNILVEKLTFSRAGIAPLAVQRLLIMLPLTYIFFKKELKIHTSYLYILLIVSGCTLLHMALAATGWFYRYEAYLVLLDILIISFLAMKYIGPFRLLEFRWPQIATWVLLFYLAFPLVLRSMTAYSKATRSCINIYDQQYQMSRFANLYYSKQVIAANDIGALSFYTNAQVLDLWGLANNEVARSRKNNYWTPDFLDSISRNKKAVIAIVYDKWFSDSLLKRWKKVASWQIQNNVVCGDSVVSFYAMYPSGASALKNNLIQFQTQLPKTVKVTYTNRP